MTYVSLGVRGSCGPVVLHVAKTGKTYHMLVTSMSSSPACPYARHKETRCMVVQMHVAPGDHGLFDRHVRSHTGCIFPFQNLSRPVIGTTFVSLHASKTRVSPHCHAQHHMPTLRTPYGPRPRSMLYISQHRGIAGDANTMSCVRYLASGCICAKASVAIGSGEIVLIWGLSMRTPPTRA
jgi:hypothetical protein